jgi:arylsulfatase A-like enzyme
MIIILRSIPRLRTEVPAYDQGYAALLNDLHQRGMMDNTLVITAGEFGRPPRLNDDARGPGPRSLENACSLTLGGGGINTGMVLGATDKHAAEITERPIFVSDFAATVYHALGLDPKAELKTPDNRPIYALPDGEIIRKLV